MKKILAIAAASVLAAAIQAAPVGWSIMGATDFADGSYSIFAIGYNGVTSVARLRTWLPQRRMSRHTLLAVVQ